ncbi:MAG: hypothetical protein V7603_6760 [Micromonosporaceae bacterium]
MKASRTCRVSGAVLGAVLAVAGCARGGNTAAPPVAGSSGVPGSVPPTGPASGPPALPDASRPAFPAPSPTSPVPGSRARTAPWTLAGTTTGGRVLLLDVTVGGTPCDLVTAVDVAESASTVRITVHAGVPTGASCHGAAAAIAATERVQVRLAGPLGARTPVDGR